MENQRTDELRLWPLGYIRRGPLRWHRCLPGVHPRQVQADQVGHRRPRLRGLRHVCSMYARVCVGLKPSHTPQIPFVTVPTIPRYPNARIRILIDGLSDSYGHGGCWSGSKRLKIFQKFSFIQKGVSATCHSKNVKFYDKFLQNGFFEKRKKMSICASLGAIF